MAVINRIIIVLLIFGLFVSTASAAETIRYVGFASMATPKVEGNRIWNQRFNDLTRALFDIKYSSFTKVASKLNLSGYQPKTMSIYGEDDELHLLRPHPDNNKAIEYFHEENARTGESYLSNVCKANGTNVLIFDAMPPQYKIDDFVADNMDTLDLRLHAYYRDSNTIGYDYLFLDKAVFKDYSRLKTLMHEKLLQVIEEIVVNQTSLVVTDDRGKGKGSSNPASAW